MEILTKYCYMCKRTLPVDSFPKNRTKKDGLATECLECARERVRRYALEHPDRKKETDRNYRSKNQEKLAQHKRAEHLAHPEKQATRNARWKRKHKKQVNTMTRRRRARKRNLPDSLTNQEWSLCLDYWYHCCAYCGSQQGFWNDITAEHYIPLADPESPGTVILNMLPACRSCNASKSDAPPMEWLINKFGKLQAKKILEKISRYFEWVKSQESP